MNGVVAMHKMRKTNIPTLIEQVEARELTVEEAAQSLAGATIRVIEEHGGNVGVDRDGLLRQARHDLDARLPGYDGIAVNRHM